MRYLIVAVFSFVFVPIPVPAQDRGIVECSDRQQVVPAWTGPRPAGFVVENLTCGQMVSMTGLEHGYVRIQLGERIGYVDARYVRVLDQTGQADQARRIAELEEQVKDLRRQQPASPQTGGAKPAVEPPPPATVSGHDLPRIEAFGGYSMLRPNLPGNLIPGMAAESGVAETAGEFLLGNILGWGAGLTVNLNRIVGISANFNGFYKGIEGEYIGDSAEANGSLHTFLFGPTFTARARRVRPFARALFGFGRISGSARLNRDSVRGSKTGFAAAVGGGVDVAVTRAVSIRAIEVDFLPYREGNGRTLTFNNIRWGAGLVIGF